MHRTHKIHWRIIISAVLLIFLNACSTVTKDGPPPYDVDVSKIPNAVPKTEKLSKYGNMPVYRVYGKNYHVMNSSKHYEAEGVASWYGTKFHKHNTSSGEKYDMLGMTAAHRTLPLPTYLEVTNEKNGRKVIVKVNDRGPFADNRLIDLSYAAAKKLDMIGHGTTHVKIKAIDPEDNNQKSKNDDDIHTNDFYIVRNNQQNNVSNESPYSEQAHAAFKAKQIEYAKSKPYQAKSTLNKPSVYLQVGAFENKNRAEKLRSQLAPMMASSVQIKQQSHPKKLYRVQIGPIKDSVSVARINKQLKSIGINSKVMTV